MLPLTATSLEQLRRLLQRDKRDLLLIFRPPRGGFSGCLLPSAKEVVLGRPLMSLAQYLCIVLFALVAFFLTQTNKTPQIYHISRLTPFTHKTCRCRCRRRRPLFTLLTPLLTHYKQQQRGLLRQMMHPHFIIHREHHRWIGLNKPSLICNGLHLPTSYH